MSDIFVFCDVLGDVLSLCVLEVAGFRVQKLVVVYGACVDSLFDNGEYVMPVVSEDVCGQEFDLFWAEALHYCLLDLIRLSLEGSLDCGALRRCDLICELIVRVYRACVYF